MVLLVVNMTPASDGASPVLSVVIIVVVVVLGLGMLLAAYMALSALKRWHNAQVRNCQGTRTLLRVRVWRQKTEHFSDETTLGDLRCF